MCVRIEIKEVNSILSINREGARLLTESLVLLFNTRYKCECQECKNNIKEKQRFLRELIYLTYPISKLGHYCTINTDKMRDKVNLLDKERKAIKEGKK